MTRRAPEKDTIRTLFAKSGNTCAFPGCTSILVNERNEFVGQICHIEAAEIGGERYNPDQTDEDRRASSNLILLCYPHHKETDDVLTYPVERLKQFKREHESRHGIKLYKIDESLLYKIQFDMERWWISLADAHLNQHVFVDMAVPIDAKASFADVIQEAYENVNHIAQLAHGWELPFEVGALALPNLSSRLTMQLMQLEVLYLQEYVKLNPSDSTSLARLEEMKKRLHDAATTAGLAD